MTQRSLTARGALILGCTAVGGLLLGVGGIQIGILDPYDGFKIAMGLGILFGPLAVIAALLAMLRTRAGAGRTGRGDAWAGLALGLLALGLLLRPALQAGGYPVIHDVTTDPDAPPLFSEAVARAPGRINSVALDPEVIARQREAFPDLKPIDVPLTPPEALERARAVALQLGWKVHEVDGSPLSLEAEAVSRIFRFVDDVVIRVRPDGNGGSTVDLRSCSRVGGGDLGANALRIRAFREAFTAGAAGR